MRPLLLLTACLFFTACSGDDDSESLPRADLPSTEFSKEYSLDDFSLAESVDYWEIRLGGLSPSVEDNDYTVLESFDEAAFEALDTTQREILAGISSQSGFDSQCQPGYCPVYAVSISGYHAVVIDHDDQLISFMGGAIDTEAELYTYLTEAQDYSSSASPRTYEKSEEGYRVVLSWDSLCQVKGVDLVMVYPDGTIEKIEEVSREEYDSCV